MNWKLYTTTSATTRKGNCFIIGFDKSYFAGTNPVAARKLIDRLNGTHRPNVEQREDGLYVCWNSFVHHEPCQMVKEIEYPVLKKEYRCCGRCDGVHDECVSDMICEAHKEQGCEICWPRTEYEKAAPEAVKSNQVPAPNEPQVPHGFIPWQKCPVCDGHGQVRPIWNIGALTLMHIPCDVCHGKKIIPMLKSTVT